ncbi:MAG: TonB family protein [Betaproteobacteria bacterium]|nr:TonB family protein [Betaproteobacteria bacterium]
MSDAALDRGTYFPSPMTDWYRERPFKVAFAVSVVIHAALIAFVPGFRSIPIETPRVLEVEIVPEAAPPIPRIQEKPVVPPKTVEPKVESIPEPIVRQPLPGPTPEPLLRQPQPEAPAVPLAEIIRAPRAEPKPEFVVPKPELRPEPKAEPRVEIKPEPKIEPRPEPPPRAIAEVPVPPSPQAPPSPPATAIVTVPEPKPITVAPRQSADEPEEVTMTSQMLAAIYLRNPKPSYPNMSRHLSEQGTVLLRVFVTITGDAVTVELKQSSGFPRLDKAAQAAVQNWKFVPVKRGEQPVPVWVVVPIKFRLDS